MVDFRTRLRRWITRLESESRKESRDHMLVLSEASPLVDGSETLIRIIHLLSALDFFHSDDIQQQCVCVCVCLSKLIFCPLLERLHSHRSITRESSGCTDAIETPADFVERDSLQLIPAAIVMKTINILSFLTSSGTCDRCRQIPNDMLIWLFPSRTPKLTCAMLRRSFRQANLADEGTVWLSCARTSFIIIVIFAFGKEKRREEGYCYSGLSSLTPSLSLSLGQIDLLDGFSHFRCALFKTSFIKTFLFLSFLFSTSPDFPTCAQRTFAQLPYLISLKKHTCLSLSVYP